MLQNRSDASRPAAYGGDGSGLVSGVGSAVGCSVGDGEALGASDGVGADVSNGDSVAVAVASLVARGSSVTSGDVPAPRYAHPATS